MQINSRRLTLLRWKTTCINMHEIMLIEFHCSFRKKVRQIGGITYVLLKRKIYQQSINGEKINKNKIEEFFAFILNAHFFL